MKTRTKRPNPPRKPKRRTSETTSARVATIAGRVLRAMRAARRHGGITEYVFSWAPEAGGLIEITCEDIEALAGSALTQKTKVKRVKRKRGRK